MSPDDLKKLRQYFHSLRGIVEVLEEPKVARTDHYIVDAIKEEIAQLLADFPETFPGFEPERFFTHAHDQLRFYDVSGLRTYLSRVIGRLQIMIEEPADTPVTQRKEFSFVRDGAIRQIVERDYAEAQRAFIAECWKSTIVLAGGMIEAVLADLLLAKQSLISSATKAPRNKPDVTRWNLAELIEVAVELKLVSAGVEKLSHPIREFRNLIHPGNEIRNDLQFDKEEARIALDVVHIVHRELS